MCLLISDLVYEYVYVSYKCVYVSICVCPNIIFPAGKKVFTASVHDC